MTLGAKPCNSLYIPPLDYKAILECTSIGYCYVHLEELITVLSSRISSLEQRCSYPSFGGKG